VLTFVKLHILCLFISYIVQVITTYHKIITTYHKIITTYHRQLIHSLHRGYKTSSICVLIISGTVLSVSIYIGIRSKKVLKFIVSLKLPIVPVDLVTLY
jgi:hypothetical protein